MTQENSPSWAQGIEQVLANDLRFKAQLDIGEDAFASLKLKRYLLDALDAGNGAITGAAIAKSSFVAGTFFAPSGILGLLGLGTAVTPLGWAIAAGALGAGLSVVIGKTFVRGNSSRVKVIPEFINTPLDILAVGLFDLIATLSLKVATTETPSSADERAFLEQYFIREWGYDPTFVTTGLDAIHAELAQCSLHEVAQTLAGYKQRNPDCNYKTMSTEVLRLIDQVIAVDGLPSEQENIARDQVKAIFDEAGSLKLGDKINTLARNIGNGSQRSLVMIGRGGKGVYTRLRGTIRRQKRQTNTPEED